MSPFEALHKTVWGALSTERYNNQHCGEGRTPGVVVERRLRDPEYADALRALRSEDIGVGVIRQDDILLACGVPDKYQALRELKAAFDKRHGWVR